jgi:hypothetical protein
MAQPDPREETILSFGRDPVIAHQVLFKNRHRDETPPFHDETTGLWHSPAPRVLLQAFRGGGKSTLSEEAIILIAALRQAKYILIIAANYERACERLTSIKYEIEHNEDLIYLFGDLVGDVWNEGRIVLRNGVCIQAFGRGQALRGAKYRDARPDLIFIDDLEEQQDVATPAARAETLRYFHSEIVPALDPAGRIRVNATPLDKDALPVTLSKDPNWITKTYPVEHISPTGERVATWPARYSLAWIDAKRKEFEHAGLMNEFSQEYLCEPVDVSTRLFHSDMIRIVPRVRTYEPTFAFIDPARTVKSTSATTGWVVWSYTRNGLVVWDGGAEFLQPSEIIDLIFRINEQYQPVVIGAERDGVDEFLMQPIRQEGLRRGLIVPVVGMKAPKGKLQFISALQPLMQSGELVFAKDIPAASQLLSYPSGRIDFPNALAYALLMKPDVVYPDFAAAHHVVEGLDIHRGSPVFVALNASKLVTTYVVMQFVGDALHIITDGVREAEPSQVVAEMLANVRRMLPGASLELRAPPAHFEQYDRIGLRAAVRSIPAEIQRGGDPTKGRLAMRPLLQKLARGEPALRVSSAARHTINALAAGYVQTTNRVAMGNPVAGEMYKLIGESIESVIASGHVATQPDRARYAIGRDGQPYKSALPSARPETPVKNDPDWWREPEGPHSALPPGHPLR